VASKKSGQWGARGRVNMSCIPCVNAVIYYLWITRFCVKVKNKPCIRRTGCICLISWIHPRGSETLLYIVIFRKALLHEISFYSHCSARNSTWSSRWRHLFMTVWKIMENSVHRMSTTGYIRSRIFFVAWNSVCAGKDLNISIIVFEALEQVGWPDLKLQIFDEDHVRS
jgi:hypothetical protein